MMGPAHFRAHIEQSTGREICYVEIQKKWSTGRLGGKSDGRDVTRLSLSIAGSRGLSRPMGWII